MSARARKRTASTPGKKPGQTSPAIARSARVNGAAGGRPRDRLTAAAIAVLGDPPKDLAAQRAWSVQAMLATVQARLRGEVGDELVNTVRTCLSTLDAALPAARAKPGDDQDDDEDLAGPELEPDDGGGVEA